MAITIAVRPPDGYDKALQRGSCKIRYNNILHLKFEPKEHRPIVLYHMRVHFGEIVSRFHALQDVATVGDLNVQVDNGRFTIWGTFQAWNALASEIVSMATDDIETLVMRFAKAFPKEKLLITLSMDPKMRDP